MQPFQAFPQLYQYSETFLRTFSTHVHTQSLPRPRNATSIDENWTLTERRVRHLERTVFGRYLLSCHTVINKAVGTGAYQFLAATKQLYKWYFPSVYLSHLFVPIIVSPWNFQELLPMTNVRSMQKVKVRGQRSRSQRSQPNLTVSGL